MENGLTVRQEAELKAVAQGQIEALLERFINDQDVKPQSRAVYQQSLKQFFLWVDRKGLDLREITRKEIIQYKEALHSEGKSSLTAASYMTSLKLFYAWLEALKIYPNVAKDVRLPKRIQQFRKQPLTVMQSADLLKHFKHQTERNYAIISLLLRTGLRTIEVIRANVDDLTVKGGKRVLMVQGKGHTEKDAFVILTEKSFQPIEEYLSNRSARRGEPLFISESNNNNRGRLTTKTIRTLAKDGLRAIGLNDKAYTAHSLRHTAGTAILRAGGSIEKAQKMLRHSDPSTTQIYTATLDEERRLADSGEALIDSLY
jgi:integrase/recombinase XerC/integrase/recombinase XerD